MSRFLRISAVSGALSFVIFGLVSCSSPEVLKPSSPTVTQPNQKVNEPPTVETVPPAESAKKSSYVIDPVAAEKSKPLLEDIVRNDEKKAKQAYGRAVRVLPEIVQLAVDLRLKNYDHASTALPKTPLMDDQKSFWGGIIQKRPKNLEKAVCEALVANPAFPMAGAKVPDEEAEWLKYFDEVATKIVNPEGTPKEKSELTMSVERVICTDRECGPINDNLRDEILTDKFFDNLHNMRRRDTRFYKANYKSPLKIWQYRPYISDMALFKFYKALKNTPYEKQSHFIRRFKGIARDMRAETILSRSIAAIILGDEKDMALARRLGSFLVSNSLISAVTRIEGELATCMVPAAPAPKQAEAPTAAATPAN
jgi:hypothetical protein